MANQKENKLAVTSIEDKGLVPIPDFMKSDIGKGGLETGNEMIFGFIKLLQSGSPEVKDNTAKAGEMINSLSKVNYGTELTFVALLDTRTAIRWIPRAKGGGIDCISNDAVNGSHYGACNICVHNYDGWKRNDLSKEIKKEICTLYLQFPALVNNESMPSVIAFEKSKYKVGAKLKSLYVNQCADAVLPIYAFKFKLISKTDKSPEGDFFNFDVIPQGRVTEQKDYVACAKWHEVLKKTGVKVDLDTDKTPF